MTDCARVSVHREILELGRVEADSQLGAVRTAILIEDVLGVVLTDEQIGELADRDQVALADLLTRLSGA